MGARRRPQRLLCRRSHAVDLRVSPSGGAGVPGACRGWDRRRALRCPAPAKQFSVSKAVGRLDQPLFFGDPAARRRSRSGCNRVSTQRVGDGAGGGRRRRRHLEGLCEPPRRSGCDCRLDRRPIDRASRVAHRRPGARQESCARHCGQFAFPVDSVSSRGHRTAAGLSRRARSRCAHSGAAALGRPHRVACAAAGAVDRSYLGRFAARGTRRADHMGGADRRSGAVRVDQRRPDTLRTAAKDARCRVSGPNPRPFLALDGTDLVGAWRPGLCHGCGGPRSGADGIRKARAARGARPPGPGGLGIEFQRFVCRVSCAVGGRNHDHPQGEGARVRHGRRAALDRHIPLQRDQLLLSHQFSRTVRDGLVLAARPGIGAEPDDLFEFLRRQTRDAVALEAERLLYVACTRAKWRLHLSAMIGRREDIEEIEESERAPWKPRTGSLLAVLWPVVGAEFALDPMSTDPVMGDVAPRGGPLYRLPRDWSLPADEALRTGEQVSAFNALREETPVFDWAGETARRVGSLVHAELQVMDLEHSDEGAIESRGPHFRRWLGLHGVPADRLQSAGARVVSALVAVHRDERARWILKRRTRDDFREYALSGRWQGDVVRVVFDRSFVDEDGVRWVIDYKTSQHAGGSLDEFLDREVDRYRPQLHRYAQLARRLGPERVRVGLYFPLMRAWREWEP